MFELLKDKMYIRYWLAVVVSFLGDALTLTTVIYIAGTSVQNPMMISYVFAASLLPAVIIGPLVGPLIDKFSSRWVMFWADLYRFSVVLAMFFFYENLSVLLLLIFLQAVGSAFFEPARMSSIPVIVGIHRIPQGIALFQSTLAVIKLLGPVIAGLLLAFYSPKHIFLIDSITYIISAALIVSLTVLKKKQNIANQEPYLKSIYLSFLEMIKTPILTTILVLLIPVMLSFGMFTTNFKAVMLQVFKISNLQFGFIEGIFAFGTVIGAMVGSKLLQRVAHYRLLFVSIGILGFGITGILPLTEWTLNLNFLLGWSFFLGASNAVMTVPITTIFLQFMPEQIRGKGTAIFYSLFNFLLLTGTLFGGYLARTYSIPTTLLAAGSILMVTSFIFPLIMFMRKGKGKYLEEGA